MRMVVLGATNLINQHHRQEKLNKFFQTFKKANYIWGQRCFQGVILMRAATKLFF